MKEQMILRLLTQMEMPYVLKLHWSFQDAESMRLVTVSSTVSYKKKSPTYEAQQFCPGGDMMSRIIQSGSLNSSLTQLYAAELVRIYSLCLCNRHLTVYLGRSTVVSSLKRDMPPLALPGAYFDWRGWTYRRYWFFTCFNYRFQLS